MAGWYRLRETYADGSQEDSVKFIANELDLDLWKQKYKYRNYQLDRVVVFTVEEFEETLNLALKPKEEEFIVS